MGWNWRTAAFQQFTRVHVAAFGLSRGRVGGSIRGAPVLLLDHVGRRSGEWRTCPLLYLPDGDDYVVIGSKGGSHKHPAWFLNLREMNETTINLGARTLPVSVRLATAAERERLWPRVVEMWSDYATYQQRTDREIPLVILSPLGDG
jgi:deazaflavin-dependent oxidoreductase (nitroreductase family)